MGRALLLSIRLHVSWFVNAFGPGGRMFAPLGRRRLLVLFLFYPAYVLLQAAHWIGFLLDEIFFPAYRQVEIKEPLIITGIARSGMTYLHRAIARDQDQFTTMRTWEALLAPSITERRLLRLLARADRLVGSPLRRILRGRAARIADTLKDFHETDLDAPEEDYLTLMPAGGCLLLCLLFPGSMSLWQLGRFYEYPEGERETLIHFYRRMLQKHLHEAGPGKRLVSKNAMLASWLPDLRRMFPDARFLYCIREPHLALSSQVSSLKPMLAVLGTSSSESLVSQQLQTIFAHNYRIILDEKDSFLIDRLAIVEFREWKDRTGDLLHRAMRRLCVNLTPRLKASLRAAAVAQRYGHRDAAHQDTRIPGPHEYRSLVGRIHAEILDHPCHIRPQLDPS